MKEAVVPKGCAVVSARVLHADSLKPPVTTLPVTASAVRSLMMFPINLTFSTDCVLMVSGPPALRSLCDTSKIESDDMVAEIKMDE